MKIPFHTEHCREGWGCLSLCPVLQLTKQFQELKMDCELYLATRDEQEQKNKKGKPDNE